MKKFIFTSENNALAFVNVSSLIKWKSFFCISAVQAVTCTMLAGADIKEAQIITVSVGQGCSVVSVDFFSFSS